MNELKIYDLSIHINLKHALVAVIDRCLDAFAEEDDDLGHTNLVDHAINTGHSPPFKEKLRPLLLSRRAFVDNEIDRFLEHGIISPADPGNCPYASPIVVVNKKEVDLLLLALALRMCIDFRRLNKDTVKDAYPLPRIDDIITELRGSKFFASLDLLMGYHQISIKMEDRPKTAFITHRGLFMFNRMPFGLCNAPATFQRLMDNLFQTEIGRILLVYLDDLLLFAKTEAELLVSLEKILNKLIGAGLKCKPRKCQLFRDSIDYLGHVISEKGIAPDPKKIEKIKQWPFPITGLEMLSLLRLCNYYRRLIPHFSEWAAPLYRISRETKIAANAELQLTFNRLKTAACAVPSLKIPDPNKAFMLETDASGIAEGAVLKQTGDQGE